MGFSLFYGGRSGRSAAASPDLAPPPRELARRDDGGVQVRLLWHPADDAVMVSVADERTGEQFLLPVARHRALEAFQHPFAYAV